LLSYLLQFDPDCFSYVVDFFHKSRDTFYGTQEAPGPFHAQAHLVDPSNPTPNDYTGSRNPLLTKQAIIVLREELEYFVIPPSDGPDGQPIRTFTDEAGIANEEQLKLKRRCGVTLLEKTSVFTALQRNVNKENNIAEQHLIDMLCMSGFNREDSWGFRAIEPNRCCISSIALVLLKTGINHLGNDEVVVDQQQMSTAQKLLLFWRKPAVSGHRSTTNTYTRAHYTHVTFAEEMLVGWNRRRSPRRRLAEDCETLVEKSVDFGAQSGMNVFLFCSVHLNSAPINDEPFPLKL
jgi:hypothetical protein